mgnify:CR=1 FL=1
MPTTARRSTATPTTKRSRTSASALLSSALLLPLGACGNHAFSEKSEVVEVIEFDEPGAFHTLIVDTGVGDISVIGEDGATGITAEIEKVGRGSSPIAAEESLESIELILAPLADDPGAFLCTSEFPSKWAGHSHAIDWRITAPSGLALDIVSDVGDVEARGFAGGARARSDVGDVTLREIAGGVDVRADVGDVRISASGLVTISSDVGDVELTIIDRGYAESQPINIRSDVGDIEILLPAHYAGLLDAETDVGDVEFEHKYVDAYSILHRSRSGKSLQVELNGKDAPAHDLRADVGDVEVEFRRSGR